MYNIRWNYKNTRLIFPNEFISYAEETKLIIPIGEFVLRKACSFFKKLQDLQLLNDGIIAKQTHMTMQEARLLRLVIMQVSQYDDDLMEYEVTIPEIANYFGITTTQTLYDDIFDICDKLTSKKIAIRTESTKNPWSFQPWMAEASYDGSVVKLALNKRIKPYVMEFNELFTQYEMKDILQLRSYYALRIYEILKMKYTSCRKKKNSFDFTLEELREMTGTEDKFKQIGIWKLRVIDIAEREINEKTDINMYFYLGKADKSRRPSTSWALPITGVRHAKEGMR